MWLLKKNETGHEPSGVEPAREPELDVGEPVGQRERQLLGGGRARLADVVAAHADRMELRHALGAEGHEVADQAQVRPWREQPLLLRDVLLQDVGLQGAVEPFPGHALSFGRGQEERERDHGRSADGHRRRDVAERDAAEQHLEVVDGIGRHPAAPDLSLAPGVVGVETHQRRHVEGHAQPALTLVEQEPVSSVRLLGDPKPANWRIVQSRPRYIEG